MNEKYHAAIIGCGNIAGKHDEEKKAITGTFSHAGAYTKNNIEIVAAADPNVSRLAEFGAYWKVKNTYSDYQELLKKENPDILSICTPDKTHYPVIKQVLRINPPAVIFAEKPLAETTEKIQEILSTAKKAGTRIVVDYQRRWDPDHMQAREIIHTGKLGTLQAVNVSYVKGIQHNGCAAVNTLQFLIDDIIKVIAIPPYDVGTFPDDPSLDAVLFFRNGAKAILQSCDKQGYSYSIFEIDILGNDGRIRLVDNGESMITYQKEPYHSYAGFFELVETDRNKTGMPFALEYAVKAITEILDQKKKQYKNSGMESYKDMLVIESILQSKDSGGIITDVPGT